MRKNVFLLILLFFVEPLLANAEDLENRIIGLPFYLDLSDAELQQVVEVLA